MFTVHEFMKLSDKYVIVLEEYTKALDRHAKTLDKYSSSLKDYNRLQEQYIFELKVNEVMFKLLSDLEDEGKLSPEQLELFDSITDDEENEG